MRGIGPELRLAMAWDNLCVAEAEFARQLLDRLLTICRRLERFSISRG